MVKRKSEDVDRGAPTLSAAQGSSPKKMKKSSKPSAGTKSNARYTAQQDRAIAEFSQVTQADKSSAARALKQTGWNVSNAINLFFNNSANAANNPSRQRINQVFDGYREDPKELENEINFEGVGRLLNDLGVGLEDIGALVFFETVQSPQLGRITREGFVDGFSETAADNTTKMRNVILARRSQLPSNRSLFKNVYNHTFSLLIEDRKKAIDLEQAGEFWKLLFSAEGFEWATSRTPWLDWWLEFLTTKWNKAVNKDLWRQTLAFAEETKKDESLSFWNEESSWPSVIDDFVEWVKAEKRSGGGGGEAMEVE